MAHVGVGTLDAAIPAVLTATVGSVGASFFGLDASEWQAVFAGVAALGTLVAAFVAWKALSYFRSQAAELKKANAATRAQVHAAVRPAITVEPAGFRAAHEFELTIGIGPGQPIRHVTTSVKFEGRDVAAECEPSVRAEVEPVAFLGLLIRASGVTVGDRATLCLTYRDSLGSRVTITYPLIAINPAQLLLSRDLDRESKFSDDLSS